MKYAPIKRCVQLWRYRRELRHLAVVIYRELFRTRVFTVAAALAYYFLLALVPMMIIISSLLQFLPIPDIFQQLLNLMATLVPPDALGFIESILISILTPNRGKLLSFGILGYLWAASGGFSALIESLNIAYDVEVYRPWWRDRLRALILTLTSGGLASLSMLAFVAGPHFGHYLTAIWPMPRVIEHLWPALRLAITFFTFVTGLEIVYYLGPNARHSFTSTLPGAVFATAVWFLGSAGLSYYLDHLSNYNATYGSMGALIGLMLWFYLIALAILIGAELNAELAKRLARLRGIEESEAIAAIRARNAAAAAAAASSDRGTDVGAV